MVNLPARYFIISHQARKDRQSRRIGRGPACWAEGIGPKVPDSPTACLPATVGVLLGVIELIEMAILVVRFRQTIDNAGLRGPSRAAGCLLCLSWALRLD